MPNVVALPHRDEPVQPEPDGYPALRRWASRMASLVTMILAGFVVFTGIVLSLGLVFQGAFLWLAPGVGFLGSRPDSIADLVPFGALPWPTRLAYAVTFTATQVPVLFVLWHLRALLRDLAAGAVFAAGHASRLRRMAIGLLVYAVAPAAGQILVRLVGHGVDLAWWRTSSLHALLLAVFLIVLSELIRAGQAIKDDRDGFV